ncbi:Restriction endonuclease [Streptomyces sp. 2112.3]|uniref:restriction endonuclease n=1 Tax=Streptomyces sp. 2112.3 TaxID=1881023 RepID=UPI000898CDAC|nr:restriction endonuclease [Streptomyces sp. 2112.3]SEE54401.1 Restriction endonuclease [Streptomyces sp. 2112.3]
MKNTGESFESYIQFIYQTLLGVQGRNISVSRRATVYDNHGNPYNIDIFYEFDVAGVHHRVAIECKDTRRPVERDDAIAFTGKIRDLPSTIGIFISKSGFQPAAKKYLQDHGIVHYAGGDLPHLGSVIASMISPIALPDESATGQPFWTLMRQEGGQTTGVWCLIPDPTAQEEGTSGSFPIFYSRPHAQWFHEAFYQGSTDVCIRGVEQPMLRFLCLMADNEGRSFSIGHPFIDEEGNQKAAFTTWTGRELAHEYSTRDLSAEFGERGHE